MTNNYDELLKLAEAATPLETELYGDRYFQGDYSHADLTQEQDAFYRACTPAVVSGILTELTALRAAASAPKAELPPTDGWLIDGSLVYKLDETGSMNAYEVNVTMAQGSRRHDGPRVALAEHIRAVLAQAAPAPLSAIDAAAAAMPEASGWDITVPAGTQKRPGVGYGAPSCLRSNGFGTPSTQAAPVAVPEGWKLVPVEPTDTMVAVGYDTVNSRTYPDQKATRQAWVAMLAAAPAAPVAAAVPAGWVSVDERLPEMDEPVWLFEPGTSPWIGGRGEGGEGWLWCSTQGTEYQRSDGTWSCASMIADDDYQPTHWQPLPAAPAPDGVAS